MQHFLYSFHKLQQLIISCDLYDSAFNEGLINSPTNDQTVNLVMVVCATKIQMVTAVRGACRHHAIEATMMIIPDEGGPIAFTIRRGASNLLSAPSVGTENYSLKCCATLLNDIT